MVKIVSMDAGDLGGVLEIERTSHTEPWREDSFRQELARGNSQLFVARIPGAPPAVGGYVCSWIVLDEIHILNLAVQAALRRRGIGRSLLVHALEAGSQRGARVALLEVREGNTGARSLYESLGFRAVGKRPNYYGTTRETAILMDLEMDGAWRNRWLHDSKNRACRGMENEHA